MCAHLLSDPKAMTHHTPRRLAEYRLMQVQSGELRQAINTVVLVVSQMRDDLQRIFGGQTTEEVLGSLASGSSVLD